jgi:tetratricopeptide (TPR) repeat protein
MTENQNRTPLILRLPAGSEAELRERFGGRLFGPGIAVPCDPPKPTGTRLFLRVELKGGPVALVGEGEVVGESTAQGRPGVMIRALSLEPETPAPRVEGAEGAQANETAPPGEADQAAEPDAPAPDGSEGSADPFGEKTSVASYESKTRVARYDANALTEDVVREVSEPQLKPYEVFGTYQVLEQIGDGGMAEVYLARSGYGHGVERLVALKLVKPHFGRGTPLAQLFLNEARISVTLQHPNVVQVFDFGEAGTRAYMAMEYVSGWSLGRLMHALRLRAQPPPLGLMVSIAAQVARALTYLHEKVDLDGQPLNLVHRDVSPSNILVTDRGAVKLLDFGVAAADFAQDSSRLVVGTSAYVSPEQAKNQSATPQWDIYSLGVVLHELLTLERLFMGLTHPESLTTSRATRLPPSSSNPNVPPALDEVVLRATDPDPSRRFASAGEFLAALEAIVPLLGDDEPAEDACAALMGDEVAARSAQVVRRLAEGRRRLPHLRSAGELAALLEEERAEATPPPPPPAPEPQTAVPRPVVSAARPAPRRRTALWLVAALVLVAGGAVGVSFLQRPVPAGPTPETLLAQALSRADEQIAAARLTGPGGDTALDHLLRAAEISPTSPAVTARLKALADTFTRLGEAAYARRDLAEAAAHYQAAVLADPDRTGAKERLLEIEEKVRAMAPGVRAVTR